MNDLKWISTKNMKNEYAPSGTVLVKYLNHGWGSYHVEYGIAYYDNPNDYEDEDGEGWKLNCNDNTILVIEYLELPKIENKKENPYLGITQREFIKKYGYKHLGNVGV